MKGLILLTIAMVAVMLCAATADARPRGRGGVRVEVGRNNVNVVVRDVFGQRRIINRNRFLGLGFGRIVTRDIFGRRVIFNRVRRGNNQVIIEHRGNGNLRGFCNLGGAELFFGR